MQGTELLLMVNNGFISFLHKTTNLDVYHSYLDYVSKKMVY